MFPRKRQKIFKTKWYNETSKMRQIDALGIYREWEKSEWLRRRGRRVSLKKEKKQTQKYIEWQYYMDPDGLEAQLVSNEKNGEAQNRNASKNFVTTTPKRLRVNKQILFVQVYRYFRLTFYHMCIIMYFISFRLLMYFLSGIYNVYRQ